MAPKRILVNRSLGLYRNGRTRILYFRKYVTGAGRAEISLRTTDVAEAERIILKTYSAFVRTPKREAKAPAIDELIEEIYEIYQGKARATFESFEGTCRLHLLPYFTGFPVDKLAEEWPKYVAYQHRKDPKRQLGHDRKHFVTILSRAVERGILPGLPKIRLDRGKRMRRPVETYTAEEIRMILSVTAEDLRRRYPANPEFWFKEATLDKLKLKVELGVFSGMRLPHEANALKYSYIDFERGTATLPPGVVKTRTGRTYPIDPKTLRKIVAMKVRAESDYVFPKRGRPGESANRHDKSWQRFKKALGITKKLYWFRHTHATVALDSGVAAVDLKRNMGTSLEMLERTYYQGPGTRQALREKIMGAGE